jgi:thioredoxin family protein
MYPHERSLVSRLQGKPFALLGINSDKDLDQLQAAMVQEQITWPSWWDGGSTSGPIATRYGVSGWPTIYVLDHQGVIRYKDVRGEDMDRAVETLLEELAQDPKAQRPNSASAPGDKPRAGKNKARR